MQYKNNKKEKSIFAKTIEESKNDVSIDWAIRNSKSVVNDVKAGRSDLAFTIDELIIIKRYRRGYMNRDIFIDNYLTNNLKELLLCKIVATGGEVTDIIDNGKKYRVHTFKSNGQFEVVSGRGEAEYLIVAGGEAGGHGTYHSSSKRFYAGIGGKGGEVKHGFINVNKNNYSIIVGTGGIKTTNNWGASDGNVTITLPTNSQFINIIAIGGNGVLGGALLSNGQNGTLNNITGENLYYGGGGGGSNVRHSKAGDGGIGGGGGGGGCGELRLNGYAGGSGGRGAGDGLDAGDGSFNNLWSGSIPGIGGGYGYGGGGGGSGQGGGSGVGGSGIVIIRYRIH